LLIGGPNQSHKVNFKELPTKGKVSNKKFRPTFVNLFSENFRKNLREELWKEPAFSRPSIRHVISFRRRAVLGGSKENSFADSVNVFSADFLNNSAEKN
jgi:hypothetical protein